jgi:hypothetical protein
MTSVPATLARRRVGPLTLLYDQALLLCEDRHNIPQARVLFHLWADRPWVSPHNLLVSRSDNPGIPEDHVPAWLQWLLLGYLSVNILSPFSSICICLLFSLDGCRVRVVMKVM